MKNCFHWNSESPCVKKCILKKNICIGCGRTLEEISSWSRIDDSLRIEINKKAANRKNAIRTD